MHSHEPDGGHSSACYAEMRALPAGIFMRHLAYYLWFGRRGGAQTASWSPFHKAAPTRTRLHVSAVEQMSGQAVGVRPYSCGTRIRGLPGEQPDTRIDGSAPASGVAYRPVPPCDVSAGPLVPLDYAGRVRVASEPGAAVRTGEPVMSVHEYLMKARHDDRLRSAARDRLAKQAGLARAAHRDGATAGPARRRWLLVLLRRVPA